MSNTKDPTEPLPNEEKFKPQHVAASANDPGRDEHDMKDVPRGSEGDRRRSAQNRS